MRLSPKPTSKNPLKGWADLDNTLQNNFKLQIKNEENSATIDPNEYSMSIPEIFEEAKKNGYKVEMAADGKHIVFH